jgi:hypothetical protein
MWIVILCAMGELQRMLQLRARWLLFVCLGAVLVWAAGCGGGSAASGDTPTAKTTSAPSRAWKVLEKVANGRIEDHGGLRVVHLWGTPEQRGRAHAELLGAEVAVLMRKELNFRFGRAPQLLVLARGMLRRLVRYPEAIGTELATMFQTMKAAGTDLSMPTFERDMDLRDLLLLNALDIFGTMGCSGFTVWGQQVAGGGVLTCRNFDWPVSGAHLVDSCILLVQHPQNGRSFAAVTWPGYAMAVTGVNEDGVCVFLHVGNGRRTLAPRKDSLPTATAARQILAGATVSNGFQLAAQLLAQTSPPAGYLTRVVLPATPTAQPGPVRVFETDYREVHERSEERLCVVTNHFVVAGEPDDAGPDSGGRYQKLTNCVLEYLGAEDRRVSPPEAWQALARVQKSGRYFASLHSMVFRQDPWCFEVALGTVGANRRVQGAPGSPRRYRLQREGVFPEDPR